MSAAAELIETLAQQGVDLRADGDQLIVRAPKGSVAPETMETLKERKAEVMAELAEPPDVKARRLKVLRMLAEDDQPRKYYWATDDKAHPEFVFLTLAIRDVGTCEMSIPKEKYDPFLLMEILDKQTRSGADS